MFAEGITLAIKQRGCFNNPCHNNAECRDKVNGEFECVCPSAFTGSLCETSLKAKLGRYLW